MWWKFLHLIDGKSAFKQLQKSSDLHPQFPGFVWHHHNSLLIFLGSPIFRSVVKMPKTIRFFSKILDFDRNSRISPESCRNVPEMPRNFPETRFLEKHLTFYIWPLSIFRHYFSPDPPWSIESVLYMGNRRQLAWYVESVVVLDIVYDVIIGKNCYTLALS